jgi:hypothetical protein
VRQHGSLACEASDAAIGVVEYDEVKFPTACGNTPRNFTDSPKHTQLLNQPWRDSAADVAHDNGPARFDSEYISRIHTHVGATDDNCPYIQERLRKRHEYARSGLAGCKVFVTFQHGVEFTHILFGLYLPRLCASSIEEEKGIRGQGTNDSCHDVV